MKAGNQKTEMIERKKKGGKGLGGRDYRGVMEYKE